MSNFSTGLEFYMLPVDWFTKVLPFLTKQTTDFPEVKINNATLLQLPQDKHAVSDDDDDENDNVARRAKRRTRWREKEEQHVLASSRDASQFPLKQNLQHDVDYVLVGPNVWTLLSMKFGYDFALPKPVKSCLASESKLAVIVNEDNVWSGQIYIPACGYFVYDSAVSANSVSDQETTADQVSLLLYIERFSYGMASSGCECLCFSHCCSLFFL